MKSFKEQSNELIFKHNRSAFGCPLQIETLIQTGEYFEYTISAELSLLKRYDVNYNKGRHSVQCKRIQEQVDEVVESITKLKEAIR